MSETWDLPAGQPAEVEFIDPSKPDQRGILPGDLRDDAEHGLGFWFYTVTVPERLGFADAFEIEVVEKWINLSTVAEIRLLGQGVLEAEIEQRRALHEAVRQRMAQG